MKFQHLEPFAMLLSEIVCLTNGCFSHRACMANGKIISNLHKFGAKDYNQYCAIHKALRTYFSV